MKEPLPTPILEVIHLRVERGNTVILDDISWRVDPGQHWAILGANGSGKTSMLRALTGYMNPTDGVIRVLGREYGRTDWRELRKEIGWVSSSLRQMMADDEPALETVITGKYAMIDLWGPVSRQDRLAAKGILKEIECGYLADRPWGYLSQGERQRVLIGRALMAKPGLLILDEPCAGMDPAARERFLQWLDRLGQSPPSPTILLVTHHVEEIMPVFTHAMALKSGRVLASGTKGSVLRGKVLSEVFDCKATVRSRAGRYALSIQ